MLNLNTNQLNVFLAAAETLNFTKAALRLQVTQPSVSQQIQALEEHIGQPLFLRTGKTVELTDAGLVLLPLAREMVFLTTHIEETMASFKGEMHGHLIIACSTSTGRYLLPRLLANFHNQFPQVKATCQITSQDRALQLLTERKAHLALVSNHDLLPEIEFHKVIDEKINLIAHPDHPWARHGEISLEQLSEAEFILPAEGSETHSALREALARMGFSIYLLKTIVSLDCLEAIALSVGEGLGVGFVPEMVVARLVNNRVVRVKVHGFDIDREIFIGRNIQRQATAAQNAFWELILDKKRLEEQTMNSPQLVTYEKFNKN
jgi:DNA-binding transcriptional LysR family regulator